MGKKIAVGIGIITLVCLGMSVALRAQRPIEPAGAGDEFSRLVDKVDRLAAHTNETDKLVLAQLAVVISNQEKILKELDIVKVRATRK